MRITVIAVDQDEVCLVRGTSAFGWRGKFGCPLAVGEAVFIAAPGREDNLRVGSSIAVQTGYEDITGFKTVAPPGQECLRPLGVAGDYQVCGTVVHCAPRGRLTVSVKGLMFCLERNELGGVEPSVGDAVEFELHGLSLWDTDGSPG